MKHLQLDLDTLKLARSLIASGWTQRAYAITAQGDRCAYDSPQATCFCASGALYRAEHEVGHGDHHYSLLSRLVDQIPDEDPSRWSLAAWNDDDGRTQEEVVALFDKAIAALTKAVRPF